MINDIPVSSFPGAVILLLITGVAALIFAVFMMLDFVKNKKIFHLLWAIAFLVLFVAGVVLVVTNNYELLLSDIVSALAVLIPGGIASGLYFTTIFDEKKSKLIGWAYLVFIVVLGVLIYVFKSTANPLASTIVMISHIPSGLSIVILPILTFVKKETGWTSILVSLGGLFMSIAGVLLAFYVTGNEILSLDIILMLLPYILLAVAVLFAFGFLLTEKFSFAIPGIKKD
jgi:hypothetical protein